VGVRPALGACLAVTAFLLVTVSCVQGHCRRQTDAPTTIAAVPAAPESNFKPSDQDHVFVYKYDGSLQCGMGKPVALEAMAKDLTGIPIKSSVKKPDGLMHIQVCGSLTGLTNVYEIPAKYLIKAESKGFKIWSFE
jgi:hypothetical protein